MDVERFARIKACHNTGGKVSEEAAGELIADVERLTRERDEARAALAACVRYQYGVNDMNGWEEAAAAWTEARRIVALST